MKRRALSILLACVFLLSVFMFCTTAFAAETNSADGVTAVLETDKDAYVAGETINATLDVENTSIYVDNIRTELIIPEGVTLEEGELKNAVELAAGENVQYTYVLSVPVAEVPTTQAPTTVPGTDDGSPETRDISMLIFGSMAVLSLAGLVALTFGAKLMKQRWFVLVLCGALLMGALAPMSASAAVTEKSFEIVKAITIDGAAAEVKAIVTYDLDDNELMETAEVPYKTEGTILWDLGEVEQGYYLPSDVTYNGVKTTKDGTYRPEVNAVYIDMLFGTEKVAGKYKTEALFNADAEQDVLIGRTDDAASLKALDHVKKNEWIVTVIDGKIVVTGWYDSATMAAVDWLHEQISADAANVALKLPMIGTMDYSHANVPDMTAGTFVNGMDSTQGAVMLSYEDVTEADYTDYLEAVEAAGYKLYQSNVLEGYNGAQNLFATYVNGDDVLHVSYLVSSLPNATEEEIAGFSSAMKKAYEAAFRASDTEIRIIMEPAANLYPVDKAEDLDLSHVGGVAQPEQLHVVNLYNSYSDGNDVGACMIYTLADGSFFVWDGGVDNDAEQLYRTLKYLNKRDDGIVIAGWVLTHAHNDHIACYQTIAQSEWAKEITVEKVIINRMGQPYTWRGDKDPYGYAYGYHSAYYAVDTLAANFKNGEDVQMVVPHTGMVMEIRNLNIETLSVGDEDVFPVIINNDNAASHVAKITYDGIDQTVMMMADSALDQTYNVFFPLFLKELDADIIQAAHHGLGGNTSRLYPIFNENNTDGSDQVAIWNTSYRSLKDNNYTYDVKNGKDPAEAAEDAYLAPGTSPDNLNRLWTDMNKALRPENGGYVVEDIVADVYTTTLNFPYTPGESQKMIIGQYKSDFFDFDEVKLAVLPTFRFGNKIEERLEKFKEYIQKDDPDVLALTVFDWMSDCYNGKDVDTIKLMAEELGYVFTYYSPAWACDADGSLTTGEGTIGQLILSRYPIASAETIVLNEGTAADSKNEGRSAGHVVIDIDGMMVDIYATHFGSDSNWTAFAENFDPQGDYWFILGNTKVSDVAKISNNLGGIDVQQAVSGYQLNILASSGALLSDAKYDSSVGSTVGCPNFDPYVRVTAELSRKVLCADMVIGEFDETPTLGQWWVNWLNDKAQKEQVLRWLIQEKPEIAGLVHVPTEVLDDEAAEEFAKLAGYEYVAYVVAEEGRCGHMLLSHYPIESTEKIILRAEPATIDGKKYEGRAYGHSVITMPDGNKVDIYYGENDSSGAYLTEQRDVLAGAVKKVADETGREFFIAGFNESHIEAEYAGKTVNTFHDVCSIVVSSGYPMDAERVYGTKAYPHDGKSPIGTTIANIDKYMKVELADVPEYKVTVNSGTGDGAYQEEETVTITADAAGKGMKFSHWTVVSGDVTLADPTATTTTFAMPAGEVVVTASYEAVAYNDRVETGETKTLKVAVMPTFRFKGEFTSQRETILNNLKAQAGVEAWADGTPADILALTLIDYDKSCGYNKDIDLIPTLVEEFKDIYPYYYYAPNWLKGTESDTDPNAGYLGHVIFSKYPFDVSRSESIELNTESNGEVRSSGHVVVNVGTEADPTWVDVFFAHMGAATNWNSGENNLYDKVNSGTGDAWLILGNARYTGMNKTNLGTVNAAFTTDINVLGGANVSYANAGVDKTIFALFPYKETSSYVDPLYFVDVTVPLYKDEGTKYPINVNGETVGWYNDGTEVTLTAPTPAAGYEFASWNLPASVNADASSETITFTMPAEILNLTVNYKEVTTATVTFDANGGFGTMDAVTVNVGAYTVPTDCDFLTPAGAVFKGWSTTKNGEAVTSVEIADDTTLYAVWEYTGKIRAIEWWCNFTTNADAKAKTIEFLKTNSYDLVGLVHVPTSTISNDAAAKAFVESIGYPYYSYVVADATKGVAHMLLSKYPLDDGGVIWSGSDVVNSTETRAFGYACATINGSKVDVFYGETQNAKSDETYVQHAQLMAAIDEKNTDNEFIVIGYNFSGITTYAGKTVAQSQNGNAIIASSGITMDKNSATSISGTNYIINMDPAHYVELDMPTKLKAIEWWCNWYTDATVRDNVKAYLKTSGIDFVSLIHVPMTDVNSTNIETFAAEAGYPYGAWVEADPTGNGVGYGHVLLSKYPLSNVVEIWNNDNLEGDADDEQRAYGYACANVNGVLVDIFWGETDNISDVTNVQQASLAKAIDEKNGDNDFILLGYQYSQATSYAGKTVAEQRSGRNAVIASSGIAMSNNKSMTPPVTYARFDPVQYAELTVA